VEISKRILPRIFHPQLILLKMISSKVVMQKLGNSFSGALQTFAFWLANGTLGHPLLEGLECRQVLFEEPSVMERLFAIFANVIELDDHGNVTNTKHAEHRAALWLRAYLEPEFVIKPPLEDWEIALH
jgi:hypothetical protein